jgi:arylsulfatase A-like enzyme
MSLTHWPVYQRIDRDMGRPPRSGGPIERYRKLPGIPLMRGAEVIETEPDQSQLTPRYTAEAINFIRSAKGNPFFLYLAHTFPHVPTFASERFRGKSLRGPYGDAVEELDWSVGEVMKAVARENLASDTLVLFTSDNGGASMLGTHGGSNGMLREHKGTTYEGGMREPFISHWPGRIRPGQVRHEVASTLDFYPTIARLAGAPLPAAGHLDGADLAPLLWENGTRPQYDFHYIHAGQWRGVRRGAWKLHLMNEKFSLYHLEHDPGERVDVADLHPEKVTELKAAMEAKLKTLDRGEPQR